MTVRTFCRGDSWTLLLRLSDLLPCDGVHPSLEASGRLQCSADCEVNGAARIWLCPCQFAITEMSTNRMVLKVWIDS